MEKPLAGKMWAKSEIDQQQAAFDYPRVYWNVMGKKSIMMEYNGICMGTTWLFNITMENHHF